MKSFDYEPIQPVSHQPTVEAIQPEPPTLVEVQSEPTELFTLFAYTSKLVKSYTKTDYRAEPPETILVSSYKLLDFTNKEFRATRAEAITKAQQYFDSIKSRYKSVSLLIDTITAGKEGKFGRIIQTPIFIQETS